MKFSSRLVDKKGFQESRIQGIKCLVSENLLYKLGNFSIFVEETMNVIDLNSVADMVFQLK